jgi:transcriptional regulator with XRE-family HTH domain
VTKVENRLIEVINQLIEDRKMLQKDMAKKLDINVSQFSRMLRMKESDLVSVKTLRKLYEEFGITPNDVLLWEETPDNVFDHTKRNG